MINSGLQKMFQNNSPWNDSVITVKVPFQPDTLVGELGQLYFNEMDRCAGLAGSRILANIDAGKVGKYLSTLATIRCVESAGSFSKPPYNVYAPFKKRVAVPVVWYQVLIGIGEAYDKERAIKFVPSLEASSENLLGVDHVQEISDAMFMLQANGFAVTAGVPKGIEGQLEFMAMSHAEGVVRSYLPNSHPVYGFLASFFNTEVVSNQLGILVRPIYGIDADYRAIMAEVLRTTNGG